MDDGQHGDGAIDIGEDDAGPGQRYGHRKAHGEQAEKAEKQDGGGHAMTSWVLGASPCRQRRHIHRVSRMLMARKPTKMGQ